jgi:hypothetical protein
VGSDSVPSGALSLDQVASKLRSFGVSDPAAVARSISSNYGEISPSSDGKHTYIVFLHTTTYTFFFFFFFFVP